MTTPLEVVLQKISRLRTYQRGERRAPYKPLLLLSAIGALIRGKGKLPYPEVEKALMPLLRTFAPPAGKCATAPEEWFADKPNEYLELHLIPKDPELWKLENYERFIEARKTLIKERFNYLLQVEQRVANAEFL